MLKHQIASYSNKKSEKQFLFKIILNWKAKVVLKPIILSQRSEVILGNTHLAIDPDCCIQDSTPMFVGNWGSVWPPTSDVNTGGALDFNPLIQRNQLARLRSYELELKRRQYKL